MRYRKNTVHFDNISRQHYSFKNLDFDPLYGAKPKKIPGDTFVSMGIITFQIQ